MDLLVFCSRIGSDSGLNLLRRQSPSFNPILELAGGEQPKVEKKDSAKHFRGKIEAHVEKHGDVFDENMAGKGLGEVDAVNLDALAKLMSGEAAGGLLEGLTIGIGFLLNFGIVMEVRLCLCEERRT